MADSTFYDLVSKGKITPFKHIRGMYYLNASLRRLGLKEVAELPKAPPQPSLENITRFAFTMIDRDLFPEPSWLLFTEVIEERVADHALLLADKHRDNVEALDDVRVKMSYFQATLDVATKPRFFHPITGIKTRFGIFRQLQREELDCISVFTPVY